MAATFTLLSEGKQRMVVFDDSLLCRQLLSDVFRQGERHGVRLAVIVSKIAVHGLPDFSVNLFRAECGRMPSLAGEEKPPWPPELGDVREIGRQNRKDALERGVDGRKAF